MLRKILVAMVIGIAWVISVVVMAIILPPCFIWVQYKLYREDKARRARLKDAKAPALGIPTKGVQSA